MTGSADSALAHPAVAIATLHATGLQDAAWLLLAFPLLGAAILLLGGKRTNSWGHLVGVAMPLCAFVYGVIAFFAMLGYPAAHRARELTVYQFIDVGRFQVPMGLRLDQLSICFVLLITGVGSLIHIFAVGYMSHDPERRRFFGYMNLFLAAMLLRDLIRQRCEEGIIRAKRKGTKFGRPQALDEGERRTIAERYAKGETMMALAEEYEVGVGTVHRAIGPFVASAAA